MFNHLLAKNYKGINRIQLNDLGHINVICGKNNSGKTSTLEALNEPSKRSIGKILDSSNIKWLQQLAEPQFERYHISADELNQFNDYLEYLSEQKTVWYSNEEIEIMHIIDEIFYTKGFSGRI